MRHDSAEIAGSRTRLDYTVDLHYDVFGDVDFVFSIHAAQTDQQRVLRESVVVEPAVAWRVDTEPTSGNRSYEDSPAAVVYCGEDKSQIDVVHKYVADRDTPWFPIDGGAQATAPNEP